MIVKKGLVVTVILLFIGLAFVPSINAKIGELSEGISQNNNNLQLETEFQRIKAYIEMKSDGDCDCISESDSNIELQDEYPVICSLLFLLYLPIWLMILVVPLELKVLFHIIGLPIAYLAVSLDCFWVPDIQGMINSNSTEIYKTLSESK